MGTEAEAGGRLLCPLVPSRPLTATAILPRIHWDGALIRFLSFSATCP